MKKTSFAPDSQRKQDYDPVPTLFEHEIAGEISKLTLEINNLHRQLQTLPQILSMVDTHHKKITRNTADIESLQTKAARRVPKSYQKLKKAAADHKSGGPVDLRKPSWGM